MGIGLVHGNDRELLETLTMSGSLDLRCMAIPTAEIRKEGAMLVINPGEVYGRLTGRSSVALVDTGKRSAEIVDI